MQDLKITESQKLLDDIILNAIKSDIPLIEEIISHIISAGGKRIRPLLTILTAKMLGYHGIADAKLGACVEFLHTATLLHDDVVDESSLRRGMPSANNLWGNKASILVGDFLLTKSFALMVEHGSLRILDIIAKASSIISEGEVLQLVGIDAFDNAYDYYLKVISAKTAALFSAACEIGGVVANGDESQLRALYEFGNNLGMIFQIIDDKLDYSSTKSELGKNIGDDFKEGKITLPSILGYKYGNEAEKSFFHQAMINKNQHDGDLEKAISIINKYDIDAQIDEIVQEFYQKSKSALAILPDNDYKIALIKILDFSYERRY